MPRGKQRYRAQAAGVNPAANIGCLLPFSVASLRRRRGVPPQSWSNQDLPTRRRMSQLRRSQRPLPAVATISARGYKSAVAAARRAS